MFLFYKKKCNAFTRPTDFVSVVWVTCVVLLRSVRGFAELVTATGVVVHFAVHAHIQHQAASTNGNLNLGMIAQFHYMPCFNSRVCTLQLTYVTHNLRLYSRTLHVNYARYQWETRLKERKSNRSLGVRLLEHESSRSRSSATFTAVVVEHRINWNNLNLSEASRSQLGHVL